MLHVTKIIIRPPPLVGYERVYLPLYKVPDTSFHIQGDELYNRFRDSHIFKLANTL